MDSKIWESTGQNTDEWTEYTDNVIRPALEKLFDDTVAWLEAQDAPLSDYRLLEMELFNELSLHAQGVWIEKVASSEAKQPESEP